MQNADNAEEIAARELHGAERRGLQFRMANVR
jgi:hypothetical protein